MEFQAINPLPLLIRRKILAWSLLALGTLGTLFFNNNVNIIPFTIIYQVLSILLGIAGMVLLFSMPSEAKVREQAKLKTLIEQLRENGATLKVDLTKCTILENSFTEAHDSRAMFEVMTFGELNRIIPDDDNAVVDKTTNTRLENVTLTILVYEAEVNGVRRKFYSQVIHKDRITLMFLIESHKQTILYYDRNNPSRCYFVLDFLGENA